MTDGAGAPAELVLGPMLRYVSETEATIWVETDRACRVGILGRSAETFEVSGHHYALVTLDGLAPGSEQEYQVALDGTVRWPPPAAGGFPPSVLRTRSPARPVRLAFGSCRVMGNAGPPGVRDADALAACAAQLREVPPERWPDVLLMIGDQVYADNPGPATRAVIERRRDPADPPGYEVADFEEYCALYREAWADPAVRWLFSVVPTAMIFDDHDVHDDWNISAAWRRDYQARSWWRSRIEGAYLSYWVYQHLGNLSPASLATDETWRQVTRPGDAAPVLRDLAHRADQRTADVRWSFSRTIGTVRVVVLDSRSRRVLGEGTRLLADEAEWQWVRDSVAGDWAHIVLATSVPPLLPRGIHALEAWSEVICAGAWGSRLARFGERLRREFDLEHWPAFGTSFGQLERLLTVLANGGYSEHGEPPASITIISGDVHHSYLTAVGLPAGGSPSGSPRGVVHQAVSSPFRQWLPERLRRAQRIAASTPGGLLGSAVARLAGAREPEIRWRNTDGPWFENMISVLEFDGRSAGIRFDRAVVDPEGTPQLETACDKRLC